MNFDGVCPCCGVAMNFSRSVSGTVYREHPMPLCDGFKEGNGRYALTITHDGRVLRGADVFIWPRERSR